MFSGDSLSFALTTSYILGWFVRVTGASLGSSHLLQKNSRILQNHAGTMVHRLEVGTMYTPVSQLVPCKIFYETCHFGFCPSCQFAGHLPGLKEQQDIWYSSAPGPFSLIHHGPHNLLPSGALEDDTHSTEAGERREPAWCTQKHR